MKTMSVAAMREKFQSLSPQTNLHMQRTVTDRPLSTTKNDSSYKTRQIQQRLTTETKTECSKNLKVKNIKIFSFSPIPDAPVKAAGGNAALAELNRSSSLTDVENVGNGKKQKRSESIGSLLNSDEKNNKNHDLTASVFSELKNRFENNSPKRSSPLCCESDSTKVKTQYPNKPVLNLKPDFSVLTVDQTDNTSHPRQSHAQGVTKTSDISRVGYDSLKSSSSLVTIPVGGFQNDLSSSFSTSTSSLSGLSKNSLVNETIMDDCGKLEINHALCAPKPVKFGIQLANPKICRTRHLPSLQQLGPPPAKPVKPAFLRCSPVVPPSNRTVFPIGHPPKRPPPKPPSDCGGKPLPPLPIQDDCCTRHNGDDSSRTCDDRPYPHHSFLPSNLQDDETYDDIEHKPELEEDEDIYETMEVDPSHPHSAECLKNPEFLNQIEERKLLDEFKNNENEKEFAKLKERFQLTGNEFAITKGVVKRTTRSRGTDLSVKEKEKVTIYRMDKDKNPSGKWFVKNEKGKFGYVELNNIEIDPKFLKNVMQLSHKFSESQKSPKYLNFQEDEEEIYQDILSLGLDDVK